MIYWNFVYFLGGVFFAIHYDLFLKMKKLDKQCIICFTFIFISFLISWSDKAWLVAYRTYEIHLFDKVDLMIFGKVLLSVCLVNFFLLAKK